MANSHELHRTMTSGSQHDYSPGPNKQPLVQDHAIEYSSSPSAQHIVKTELTDEIALRSTSAADNVNIDVTSGAQEGETFKAEKISTPQPSQLLQPYSSSHSPPINTNMAQPDTKPAKPLALSLAMESSAGSGKGNTGMSKKSNPSTPKPSAKALTPGLKDESTAKKPATKKRKLDTASTPSTQSKEHTPFSQRSATPSSMTATGRASKAPTPAGGNLFSMKSGSNTPAPIRSSPPPPNTTIPSIENEDNAEDDDGNELFCVCRRPDDHTWMIACDGGCDDWFHGRCVQMDESDGQLIDKYICPNCTAKGKGNTMWKPMCRLPECRQPARVAPKNKKGQTSRPSKYCSDEHGELFMQIKALGTTWGNNKSAKARKRRKSNHVDNFGSGDDAMVDAVRDVGVTEKGGEDAGEEQDDGDGHQAHLRGGVLQPSELTALARGVRNVDEFKKLGEKIQFSRPTSSSKSKGTNLDGDGDVKMEDTHDNSNGGDENEKVEQEKLQFTEQEEAQLKVFARRTSDINRHLLMHNDREKFLSIIRIRHKSVLEELKKKDKSIKDICGFDGRLAWSDVEFDEWRNSDVGRKCLKTEVLDAPIGAVTEDGGEEETGLGMCKRKRCERHKNWARVHSNEISLERSNLRHNHRKIETEEEGIRERAVLRGMEGEK